MIPVNQPVLDGNERKYLAECIETGWISSEGPFVAEFETRFAARVSRKHGVAVANGSAALDNRCPHRWGWTDAAGDSGYYIEGESEAHVVTGVLTGGGGRTPLGTAATTTERTK